MTRTVVAPATPMVPSAIGVVRLSGPQAQAIGARVFGPLPLPRRAALRTARDAEGRALDEGLVLNFPGPQSYTGEDVVEFQGHGSPAAMAQIIDACVWAGAVMARPGEFTERAFRSGKLDLSQAEAVADLIHARSQRAARAAAASLQGALGRAVEALQADLTRCRVRLEANLDFPEEDGVDPHVHAESMDLMARCAEHGRQMLAQTRRAQRLQEGLRLALLGPPNVGKSSLLNALAGDEVAIVSDVPGTTRDRVLGHLVLDGVPIEVIDTAGLRETQDPVEAQGIARSRRAAGEVDLIVWLGDATGNIPDDRALLADVLAQRARARADRADVGLASDDLAGSGPGLAGVAGADVICVLNKADAAPHASLGLGGFTWDLMVSARSGQGLDDLRGWLVAAAGLGLASEEAGVWSGRERHRQALAAVVSLVSEAQEQLALGSLELSAESLRLAQAQLSQITGSMTADDLLGEIFSTFCIGK